VTALVLPEPASITPAQIPDICRVVEAEALATDDVRLITEMHARWSAVTEYLALKSKDGIAQAEATKLRLLARIGELSPPAPTGAAAHRSNSPDTGRVAAPLSPNRLTEARQLAAHPDVVADVIARSTDDAPPTKAQALRQIREKEEDAMPERPRTAARRQEAVALHEQGLNVSQIAHRLGIPPTTAGSYLKSAGRHGTSNRAAIDRITTNALGLADAANQIDGSVHEPDDGEIARWVGDLTKAIRAFSQLRTRIKETNQQ